MARHIDEVAVTRESLLHRYVNATPIPGMTYARALDQWGEFSLSALREYVEAIEERRRRPGRRRQWSARQPTTSLQGIAR